jgi:hypothetical protein
MEKLSMSTDRKRAPKFGPVNGQLTGITDKTLILQGLDLPDPYVAMNTADRGELRRPS